MVRAVDQSSFQPKIGFKTRYGMVANPFAEMNTSYQAVKGQGRIDISKNIYYRRMIVNNLM
jgi:hypothetical protein